MSTTIRVEIVFWNLLKFFSTENEDEEIRLRFHKTFLSSPLVSSCTSSRNLLHYDFSVMIQLMIPNIMRRY